MTVLRLSKLHATGNDFLVLLALDPDAPKLDPATVAALCDRHRGIGADGLIEIGPGGADHHCTMTLHNADGGAAEMSGNGIRCLAWVAARTALASPRELVVDTDAGRRVLTLVRDAGGRVTAADVDMGPVSFRASDVRVVVHGVEYCGDVADVGNPHLVCFVDDPATVRVASHGPRIEHDPQFPNRTNVEFVKVTGPDELTLRVWERGVGETLSCGTGACAAAAAAHRRGLVGTDVRVMVLGGELQVRLGPTVRLGGPVVHVFDVEIEVA